MRFGPSGAAVASIVLTALASWRTLVGGGPFSSAIGPALERLLYVQVFFGLATASALVLAAVAAERRRSERAATRLQREVVEQSRRNEETLALLDALLRSSPVGIGVFDRDLRFVRVNESLARLDGIAAEAHRGLTALDVSPELGGLVEAKLREVRSSGVPILGFEITGKPAQSNATVVWNCTWFPIRQHDGASDGVGAIIFDVTDRVVAEQQREQALLQARDAVRLRDDFLQVASHELKTPLTPLSARLAMLERRAAAGERIEPEAIARARSSLRKLIVLVDELLDVTHIREASQRESWEACSLRDLVSETVAPFHERSDRHRLEIELPELDVRAACDRANLGRVFANLLDNAFKYSPGGGRIRVRLAGEGEDAVVTISDEGIGIPKEDQARLFTRFARARNAPTRSYGGLGLGLYMSREVVERHGGQISVASEEGRGSTFTVRIPLFARGGAHAPV
jgi:PAS domain S-box-containing protein